MIKMIKLLLATLVIGCFITEYHCQVCNPACINGGICVSAGGAVCACPVPYSGTNCGIYNPPPTTPPSCPLLCQNGGVCVTVGGSNFCACPARLVNLFINIYLKK